MRGHPTRLLRNVLVRKRRRWQDGGRYFRSALLLPEKGAGAFRSLPLKGGGLGWGSWDQRMTPTRSPSLASRATANDLLLSGGGEASRGRVSASLTWRHCKPGQSKGQ